MAGQIQMLQETINQVVKGKQKVVEKVLCAMLASTRTIYTGCASQ